METALRFNLLEQLCAQLAGLEQWVSTKLGEKEGRAALVPLT